MIVCDSLTRSGAPCRASTNLCPSCGKCLSHCPHRVDEAREARARGGRATRGSRRGGSGGGNPHRFVDSTELPERPLDDIEAVIAWLVWLARITVTGVIDPATSRETNRVLVTLKAAFQVKGYQQRIRELEKLLKRDEAEVSR